MDNRQKEINRLIEENSINKAKLARRIGMKRATLNNQLYYAKKIDYDLYLRIKHLILGDSPAKQSVQKMASPPPTDITLQMLYDRIIKLEERFNEFIR